MALTGKQRQALVAESHKLKAAMIISAEEPSQRMVDDLRTSLAGGGLIKVRINVHTGELCDAMAAALATRVPCEVVKRIGRVVLFYKSAAE